MVSFNRRAQAGHRERHRQAQRVRGGFLRVALAALGGIWLLRKLDVLDDVRVDRLIRRSD